MYKVMIVDDESAIRNGLINFIRWDTLGCEICGEAANGLEAIDKLPLLMPDIVITDIKMPGLGGIELSKHIKENYPSIKVIILTGFADFSFAQSAIKFGVVDFVLKPTSKEKIFEAIAAAKRLIISDRERSSKLHTLENAVKGKLHELQKHFFLDIFHGILSNQEDIAAKAAELSIELENYYVLAFEIESTDLPDSGIQGENGGGFASSISGIIHITLKDIEHHIFTADHKMLCVILNFSKGDSASCMPNVTSYCEEILRTINTFADFSISIGISKMQYQLSEIGNACIQAVKALSLKFFNENHLCIFSNTGPQKNDYNLLKDAFLDNLLTSVQDGLTEESVSEIKAFFEMQKNTRPPIEHIKNIGIQIYSLCIKIVSELNMNPSKVINIAQNPYIDILQSSSISELEEIILSLAITVTSFINNSYKPNNFVIRKSLEYINGNYMKNITLQMLADHVHVNSSYLSRLFRKETGETVTDRINRVRLEKAKELLLNSEYKTYEVALTVGFEDSAYFSQVFKKYTGYSPKDYKYSK